MAFLNYGASASLIRGNLFFFFLVFLLRKENCLLRVVRISFSFSL